MTEEKRFDFGKKYNILEFKIKNLSQDIEKSEEELSNKIEAVKETAFFSVDIEEDTTPETITYTLKFFNDSGSQVGDDVTFSAPNSAAIEDIYLDYESKELVITLLGQTPIVADFSELIDKLNAVIEEVNVSKDIILDSEEAYVFEPSKPSKKIHFIGHEFESEISVSTTVFSIKRSNIISSGTTYGVFPWSTPEGLQGEAAVFAPQTAYMQINTTHQPFPRNTEPTPAPIVKIEVTMAATGSLRSGGFRTSSSQICSHTEGIGTLSELKSFTATNQTLEWEFDESSNLRYFQYVPSGNTNIAEIKVFTKEDVSGDSEAKEYIAQVVGGKFIIGTKDQVENDEYSIAINDEGKVDLKEVDGGEW